jgi:2-C-methyl-D-erythritol 2,4-cyclodiphosphate synthase
MRIGQGLDVHAFSDDGDRELWLGLVRIPDAIGLVGHSDADVVTHALCDALLGAGNLGDLGRHFPDNDPAFAGISSRQLLEETVALLRVDGYRVLSGDVTIIAERPKLALFMPDMSHELSDVVGATISVKATTFEGLGAFGRGEGIGASAVVLVEELA